MAASQERECPMVLRGQHPAVLRVLASYQTNSPELKVSDPVQSKQGCFKQLRKERCLLPGPTSGTSKQEILQLKALDNQHLAPVARNQTCTLNDLTTSSLFRRRAQATFTQHSN